MLHHQTVAELLSIEVHVAIHECYDGKTDKCSTIGSMQTKTEQLQPVHDSWPML
jgi:hypothetical protein